MELCSTLQHLQLSSASPGTSLPLPSHPGDVHSCPPITEVLDQLREKLIGAPEKASDLEEAAIVGLIEQLFRKADAHWLFSVEPANGGDRLQEAKRQAELEKAYVGLVRSLTQWAALPLCETDSGSLPASSYQGIPARALPVCSALSALLGSMGDWERGREAEGEREIMGDRDAEGKGGREAGVGTDRRAVDEREAGSGVRQFPGVEAEIGAISEAGAEASVQATRTEAGPKESTGSAVSSVFGVQCCSRPEPIFPPSLFSSPGCEIGARQRSGDETGFGLESGPGTMPRQGPRSASLVHSVASLCCVFAVTHFQEQPWTSPASRIAASSLLVGLLRAGGWRDPGHLLMEEEEEEEEEEEGRSPEEEMSGGQGKRTGIFGGILDILQPELTKERWPRCEAVKLVFSWSLLQVFRPALSAHLPRLFPPSLLFSDHHRLDNRILGVRCLHHIVLNTPAADLRQYNRAEVLYQALYNHLYTNEATLIQAVLPCLLDLLPVLEKPPSHPSPSPRKPGRHDNVLRLLLTHMEMEHKVALRCVYASSLPLYIDRMGIAISRHLKRLERVVVGYLEVSDAPEEQSRLGVLDALEKMLSIAWPRMESRASVLLRSLLRLLVDVSTDSLLSASVREQLMEKTAHCLTLLDHCTHGKLQPLLQQVDSSCASGPVLSCLETVTMATQR